MLKTRLAALLVSLLLAALPAPAAGEGQPKLTVYYFYSNACASCNAEAAFYETYGRAVGGAADGVDADVLAYNTFRTQDGAKFQEICETYGIPEEERTVPMVVIGGRWLRGEGRIGEGLRELFMNEKARLLAGRDNASTVLYFYVSPCDECAAVKEFMDALAGSYTVNARGEKTESPLAVASWNAAEDEGLALIHGLFERYGVPADRQQAPIVFLRGGTLCGEAEITGLLVEQIMSGGALGTALPGDAAAPDGLTAGEWPGIFLTGLVNGLNPCSVSLLLFLIALLLARNANVLKLGLWFIAGKAVAYMALGTVLFGALKAIDGGALALFQDVVKYVLLAALLAAAAMNLSDFVAAKTKGTTKYACSCRQGCAGSITAGSNGWRRARGKNCWRRRPSRWGWSYRPASSCAPGRSTWRRYST